MRTTVTLDPDVEELLRRDMDEHGLTFKEAVNRAIRRGSVAPATFATETASMGRPLVDLDRALQIAAGLEDDQLVLRLRAGS